MDSKGQLNPPLVLGIIAIILGAVILVAVSGFQMPPIEAFSLRTIICGASTPVCNAFDPGTWFNCIFGGFVQWLCYGALPLLAAVIVFFVVVLWLVSTFPQLAAAPLVPVVIGVIAAIAGFFISAAVLDYWWVLVIIAVAFMAFKKLVMKQ